MSQTELDWELIVCDSYSDDGTWEYLQTFAGDPRVRLFQVPKEGLYAGWNECLRRTRGEFIYIATADDTCEPALISTLVRALNEYPLQKIAACEYIEIDHDSRKRNRTPPLYDQILNDFSQVNCFVTTPKFELAMMALCGVTWGSVTRLLFRSHLLDITGFFPTQWGISGDFAWCLRAAQNSGVVHVRQPLATWRIHAGQASNQWSMNSCLIYFRIFESFIRSEKHQLSSELGWTANDLTLLVQLARKRYEQDLGWVLSDLIRRPYHFFARMCKIYRMDPTLFRQRLLAGCLAPDWNAEPKFGLARSLCSTLRIPQPAEFNRSRS
jgi:hypothetical protein